MSEPKRSGCRKETFEELFLGQYETLRALGGQIKGWSLV